MLSLLLHTHTHSYLYIGDFLTIKRIPADGSGNPQDVYSEFFAIKGLAIDVTNNFLYWTVERDIKYLNMTHWETLTETERPSIFPEPVDKGFEGAIPHGISVINNTIYWTEDRELSQENPRITRPGAIYSLSLPTNTAQRLLQNDSLSPQDISTFINISGVFECVLVFWSRGPALYESRSHLPKSLGMGLAL